ncbi:chemotaxis protein CheW [Stutzerimonas sp. VN223-3]
MSARHFPAPLKPSGLINLRGQILPVVDLAGLFSCESPQRSLWRPMIWLRTSLSELILTVESVAVVLELEPNEFFSAPDPSVPSDLLRGVARSAEGMLLIQDVERLLSSADEQRLAEALAKNIGTSDESV